MATLGDIQAGIAAMVDQNEDINDISDADTSLRLNLINNRQRKWAEVTDWSVLYREHFTNTSQATGNVTVSMPSGFRKLGGFPETVIDGTVYQLTEIKADERRRYNSSDRYCYQLGDDNAGRSIVLHPGTSDGNLASGASIFVPYYASPATLSTNTDVISCPNPEYLISGVIADIWESREDARFQQKKAEAEQILAGLLELETTHSKGADFSRVRTREERINNFRWGKDK